MMDRDITRMVTRNSIIAAVTEPTPTIRQRVAMATDALNQASTLAIRVGHANLALAKFTTMLYALDSDGSWQHVDRVTHRLLDPAPWASGWQHWGLRHWEATILGRILQGRVTDRERPCLFDYSWESKTWHLNVGDYATLQSALWYVDKGAIKLAEWRTHSERYQERNRSARMLRLRRQKRAK